MSYARSSTPIAVTARLYSTPSEFVRDLLRQRKFQLDAESARDGILAGYRDAVDGRVVEFRGDLQGLLKKAVR